MARRSARRSLLLCILGASFTLFVSGSALATPTTLTTNGQADLTYGAAVKTAGGPGTSYKPESKLFYTEGIGEPVRWWAVLGTSGPSPAAGVWLWELADHVWVPRILLPGADPWTKADVLYDRGTLEISLRDDQDSAVGNPKQSTLYSMQYLGSGAWGPITGPTPITTSGPETLTIARDSVGRVWTTYESGDKIKVGFTEPLGSSFAFFTLSKSNVTNDDISSIIAFGGDRIGVLWSDQNAKRDIFAWRSDADPLTAEWHFETAYGHGVGGCPTSTSARCADDHLNVKVVGDEVFVAIKTSLNDAASPAPGDPLIALLHRSSDGSWTSSTVATVEQNATRPIVVVSPSESRLWVWASRDDEIDVWESPLSSPTFTSSAYIPWVTGVKANDATSTKQVATAESGVVVEVSVTAKNQYWHNEFLPG